MKGVVVASDKHQEWLLPWWWERYSAKNGFPVTFVDMGITEEKAKWCAERGQVVKLEMAEKPFAGKEAIASHLTQHWESLYGPDFWTARQGWFKKPFALLCSPYDHSLWLDLDCEVLADLAELFGCAHPVSKVALVKEYGWAHLDEKEHEILYNSGLIVFEKNSPLIRAWADAALTRSHEFWSDEHLLSHLIVSHQLPVANLPDIYNWRISQGVPLNAKVVHWVGSWGKQYIQKFGGISQLIEKAHRLP